jgi:hypothetical protein
MLITLEPPYGEWRTLLEKNRTELTTRAERLGSERLFTIREAVYEAALSYSAMLAGLAESRGLSISMPQVESFDRPRPIVMAGHQPVVYHPGLLFKNERLSCCARENNALAINVIIDTDEGDAGKLVWPLRQADSLVLKSATVSSSEGVFASQHVVSAQDVREVFQVMSADLATSGLQRAAESAAEVSALYQSLAGQPMAVANSLVRWRFEDRAYLEVPLSHLLRIGAVRDLLLSWVSDYERLVSTYNSTLDAYRIDHKIKNPANPFPNMRLDASSTELPFWLVGSKEREALVITRAASFQLPEDRYLAPRGSIVTLLLRGFCSDLFIHGKGGSKYDPFVDRLAESYLGVSLPQFVVASSTRYAFTEHLTQLEDAMALKSQYKEIVSHTEKFLGRSLFASEEERVLGQLARERHELVSRLKNAESPQTRSAVTHELNDLNRRIKQAIDTSSLTKRLADAAVPEVVLARWRFREYPFFFWRCGNSTG